MLSGRPPSSLRRQRNGCRMIEHGRAGRTTSQEEVGDHAAAIPLPSQTRKRPHSWLSDASAGSELLTKGEPPVKARLRRPSNDSSLPVRDTAEHRLSHPNLDNSDLQVGISDERATAASVPVDSVEESDGEGGGGGIGGGEGDGKGERHQSESRILFQTSDVAKTEDFSEEKRQMAVDQPAELCILRRIVRLHQEKDEHLAKSAEIQRRIAQDEKDIGILLLEAGKYKEAARQRSKMMEQARLDERSEQESYKQKLNTITDLQSQIA